MTLHYQLLVPRKIIQRILLSFTCAFFSPSLFAEGQLVIAVGLAKPPYVIQENDSGFELELVRNLFDKMEKTTQFVYTQFGHSVKMLAVNEVDAVMTTNSRVFHDTSLLSDVYITYQNVAISLKKNNLTIEKIADLSRYTIASFQKADKVLGEAFSDAVNQSPLFMKVAEQSRQPSLLLKERIEVLIMDINIFKHFAKELGIKDINERFSFHEVFPESHYRIAFKDKKNVALFNQVLAEFKQSNDYTLLKQRYSL